jgi:hypothetical protein
MVAVSIVRIRRLPKKMLAMAAKAAKGGRRKGGNGKERWEMELLLKITARSLLSVKKFELPLLVVSLEFIVHALASWLMTMQLM